jgi:hypothetical protein
MTTALPAPKRTYAAVIGDVVGSRTVQDRQKLQEELKRVLTEVGNLASGTVQKYRLTIGDEFQGIFTTLGFALRSAVEIRFSLRLDVEIRFGIGWGRIPIASVGKAPYEQDGPAWWAARRALDDIRRSERSKKRPSGWLVGFDAERRVPELASFKALAIAMDALIFRLKPTDRAIALGLLRGHPQTAIARRLGVTPSAIAQRAKSKGLHSIREIFAILSEEDA